MFDAAFIVPAPKEMEVLPPPGLLLGTVATELLNPELLVITDPPELVPVSVEPDPRHIGLGATANVTVGSAGCALITKLPVAGEVQFPALVTVNV
jgi:hypothetical protein